MSETVGSPDEILAYVQAVVAGYVPDAVCELQNYKTTIGCGALDDRGILHEIKWGLKGLNDWRIKDQAAVLASRCATRPKYG